MLRLCPALTFAASAALTLSAPALAEAAPASATTATTKAVATTSTFATVSRRNARSPWTSGIPISRPTTSKTGLGWSCTAGLPARKGRNVYLLTAGHCGSMGQRISTAWIRGHRATIGTVTGTSSRLDVSVVRVTNGTVTGRYWAGNMIKPIAGTATVKPGQKVCQNGARSGRVCSISVVDNTRDRAGNLITVYGRVGRGVAAQGGDSGSLVTDSRGRAVGIVSAISRDGKWISWTPVNTALANWGLSAVTR